MSCVEILAQIYLLYDVFMSFQLVKLVIQLFSLSLGACFDVALLYYHSFFVISCHGHLPITSAGLEECSKSHHAAEDAQNSGTFFRTYCGHSLLRGDDVITFSLCIAGCVKYLARRKLQQ